MIIATAWALLILGFAHLLYGAVRFRQPLAAALRDGWVGQFAGMADRRLAFWFMITGPFTMLGGQVALHAAHAGDLGLLKIVGLNLLLIAALGVLSLPKSPFWLALLLCPVFIAGGYGWLAL